MEWINAHYLEKKYIKTPKPQHTTQCSV